MSETLTVQPAVRSTGQPHRLNLLVGLSPRALLRAMGLISDKDASAKEVASTLYRFFRSAHVVDLKLMFTLGLSVLLACLVFIFVQVVASCLHLDALKDLLQPLSKLYAGSVLTVGGVVIAWAYRAASTRLGVVDLFACEIGTLCRVGTILDVSTRYVEMYERANAGNSPDMPVSRTGDGASSSGSYTFVSEEQYFPVFDNNARDLQLLEAKVVNNIVEFYTYMKAMRDLMRRLAQPTKVTPDAWRESITDVVYMLFLAYESARKAVKDLVEFEPAEAERTMVILVTELRCYALLLKCFDHDDFRCKRLRLRKFDYDILVKDLCKTVRSHSRAEKDWWQAQETVDELEKRYEEVFGERPAAAA